MIKTRWLPSSDTYASVWQAMRDFTEARGADTPDEIWLIEHQPVYTLGQAGKAEHILNHADIPVVHCDRGGQVTYHGPGQITVYCLINLRRYHLFVKEYVSLLENVLIDLLHDLGVAGARRLLKAPGVYVPAPGHAGGNASASYDDTHYEGLAKIAALGIKMRNGSAYHGLALNVAMDLAPFDGINPCGYPGLLTTDLRSCGVSLTVQQAGDMLAARLTAALVAYGQHKRQEASQHDNGQSAFTH